MLGVKLLLEDEMLVRCWDAGVETLILRRVHGKMEQTSASASTPAETG